MKKLHLSVITTVINEEGEKKLKGHKEKRSDAGLTAEDYDRLGIKPPKGFELEEDSDVVELEDTDIDYDSVSGTLPLKNIDCYIEDVEIGTIVYMKSGLHIHVFETCEDIDDYIEYLEASPLKLWWITQKIRIQQLINKFKHVN